MQMCFMLLSVQIDIDNFELFFINFTVFVHIHIIYVHLNFFSYTYELK